MYVLCICGLLANGSTCPGRVLDCRGLGQSWRTVLRARTHFEEILSRAHGNFEEQNMDLELSIAIINYCIIINANCNCIIRSIIFILCF